MSKQEREAEINRKIEEIRNRNKEIARRHQEIEADKQNADSFSLVAIEKMKSRPVNENVKSDTTDEPNESRQVAVKPRKESRKVSNPSVLPSVEAVTYRPPRLSENDLPPPDPVYSFLTDRLRQGAFCAPPKSPPARRRSSTVSTTSDFSSDSSRRSSVSRKLSTASNSSWTSDSSCGFANYQPPRRFSRCHSYVKNRRVSDGGYFSPAEEVETEMSGICDEKQRKVSMVEDKIMEKDEINIKGTIMEEHTSIPKDGNSRNRQQRKKGIRHENKDLRSDRVSNWRNRQEEIDFLNTNTMEANEETNRIINIEEAMTGMALTDLNNNENIATLNQPPLQNVLLEAQ